RAVALDHRHLMRRVVLLHQQGDIQAGRSAADAHDAHQVVLYPLPMNRRSSAIGTAPRPWIGAIVSTSSLSRWISSNSLTASSGGVAGGGASAGPGLNASASISTLAAGREINGYSLVCVSPLVA